MTLNNFNFDLLTYKEVRDIDLKNIRRFLNNNKHLLYYDNDYDGWCIRRSVYDTVVNELYYDNITYINPMELERYIDDIIEKEMNINKEE